MNDEERLRAYLEEVFDALCDTHADELDSWLVIDLQKVRDRYDNLKDPISEDLAERLVDRFDEACQVMRDRALWNEEGTGYKALTLLRRGVR